MRLICPRKLRSIRKRKTKEGGGKYTQADAAQEIAVTLKTYSRWELGESNVGNGSVAKIAEWAECDVIDLMPVESANLFRDFLNKTEEYVDGIDEVNASHIKTLVIALEYIDSKTADTNEDGNKSVTDMFMLRFGKHANRNSDA